eukprot:7964158-Pyramimonas_sp.AAC.1
MASMASTVLGERNESNWQRPSMLIEDRFAAHPSLRGLREGLLEHREAHAFPSLGGLGKISARSSIKRNLWGPVSTASHYRKRRSV